ncbi:EAL domain-containing protein [Pseudomonas sp. R2.Fl]|nr:EAL domain-containing protein [Pseudomonas sp. R2.Fl]
MSSLYTYLVRGKDGAWSTAYGPFVLRTALQPMFRQPAKGVFELAALQGLVRAEKNGDPYSPQQFLPLVESADMPRIDDLLRAIHILNAGLEDYENASVFVSLNPDFHSDPDSLRHALEHIRLAAHEAAIPPSRIVCEIPLGSVRQEARALALARQLRDTEFQFALSDYGAGEGDLERVHLFKPRYARFDNAWVRDFMHNPAGVALIKVVVRQFVDNGCEPIFDRLEEEWQIELCGEIGVPLLQGYGLAEPRLAPAGFRRDFPPMLPPVEPMASASPPRPDETRNEAPPAPKPRPSHHRPVFGKRHG